MRLLLFITTYLIILRYTSYDAIKLNSAILALVAVIGLCHVMEHVKLSLIRIIYGKESHPLHYSIREIGKIEESNLVNEYNNIKYSIT